MASYLRAFRQGVVRTAVAGSTLVVVVEVTTHLPSQGRASDTYHRLVDTGITPLLRRYLDPERAHQLAILSAKYGLAPIYRPSANEQRHALNTIVLGMALNNPIGLAAGFDKHGEAIVGLESMGFGFVEIGSVTPLPQDGNPKPRMFRLLEDLAIINRYGFNSEGVEAVADHLRDYRESLLPSRDEPSRLTKILKTINAVHKFLFPLHFYTPSTLVGVNLGKNKESTDEIADYCQGIRTLGPYADYIVINVSSPNTPGLRDLQAPDTLKALISTCLKERNQSLTHKVPLLVKLAPDLSDDELRDIADTLLRCGVDGLIVCNTTNQRPENLLSSTHAMEIGGLSGSPLKDRSTECIKLLYHHTKGALPIIGVGGIESANDVMTKLKAGASLVQIYSTLAYQGPGVVTKMRHELAQLLRDEGFKNIRDVVGYHHEELYWKRKEEEARNEQAPVVVVDSIDDEARQLTDSDDGDSKSADDQDGHADQLMVKEETIVDQ